ncbi:methyl-accepting chemotaxis protein [Lachnospiraceae bacterium KM106-2]|nr:methyl-accepting chemotaxis protein [Lachnospiraceae bacterium KM106-2]
MKKISSKIVLAMVACSLIMTVATAGILLQSYYRNQRASIYNEMKQSVKVLGNNIQEVLDMTEKDVASIEGYLGETLEIDSLGDSDYIKSYSNALAPMLRSMVSSNEKALGIAFFINPELTKEANQIIYERKDTTSEYEKMVKFKKAEFTEDNPEMQWYYNPIREGKGVWSDPHSDEFSDSMRFSYTKPIYKDNQLIAVVAIDLFFDEYQKMVSEYQIYDHGYAFLVNHDMEYIVHKDYKEGEKVADTMGKSIDFPKDDIGLDEYTVKGQKIRIAYCKLSNGNIIAIHAVNEDSMSGFYKAIKIGGVLILILLTIFNVSAKVIGTRIAKPITEMTKLINLTASLQLGEEPAYEKYKDFKDETGHIANSIYQLREILKNTISEIKYHADDTANQAHVLEETTTHLSNSSKEISNASTELAEGSAYQAEEATNGNAKLIELGKCVEEAMDHTNVVKKVFEETKTANSKGIHSLNELDEKLVVVTKTGVQTNQRVEVLSDKSESIGAIVDTINNIAEQIGLLSLNASIEAAKAGEAGRGFVVVAEEIRKLSDATAEAVSEIEMITREIIGEIQDTKANMNESNEAIADANTTMKQSGKILEKMDQSFREMESQVTNLIQTIHTIEHSKNVAIDSIEGISAICQQSAAATEEVAATIDTQMTAIEDTATVAKSLADGACQLEELMQQFKL